MKYLHTIPRIRRDELPPGDNLCRHCTAKCCRYFALPIDAPETRRDFDHLRWYLMHGRCAIFVDSGTWYLMVYGDCENLQEDHRCGIYATRPRICRQYSTANCEFDADSCYDRFFETAAQIEEYAEAVLPPPRRRPACSQLPVLSG